MALALAPDEPVVVDGAAAEPEPEPVTEPEPLTEPEGAAEPEPVAEPEWLAEPEPVVTIVEEPDADTGEVTVADAEEPVAVAEPVAEPVEDGKDKVAPTAVQTV